MSKGTQLIKEYNYLVKKIIRENFLNFDINIKELEAIGYLELAASANIFDKKKDGTFISFASKNIYNNLREYVTNSINFDLKETNISFPLNQNLTEKETKELFTENFNCNRDKIINGNLWIVAHIINCYFKHEKDKDDLLSIGLSALVDFVDNFSSYKNNNFHGRCSMYICRAIKRYLMHERFSLSLDEIIDNDQEKAFNLIDYSFDDFQSSIENKEIIHNILSSLTEKEKTILIMFCNGSSSKEIAEKINQKNYKYIYVLLHNIQKKARFIYTRDKGGKYKSFEEKVKELK